MTITINATIAASTGPGTVSNQGTASFDADGNGTNEASALTDDPSTPAAGDATSFTVTSPATVTATKTVSGPFYPGGPVTYTVVLTNTGPSTQVDNPGNEFIDVLPASLTLVSARVERDRGGDGGGTNTVTWNGSLASGASVTITITATIAASTVPGTLVSNQGTASFDADGNGTNEASAPTDDPGVAGAVRPDQLHRHLPGDRDRDQDGDRHVQSRRCRHLHGRPVQRGTGHADRQSGRRVHRRPAGQSDTGQCFTPRAGPRWRRWEPTPSRGTEAWRTAPR